MRCEFYSPILLSAFINLYYFERANWYLDVVSIILAYIIAAFCVVYPILVCYELFLYNSSMDSHALCERFPLLLEGMKNDKKIYLLFYPLFFAKRHIIVFTLVFLKSKDNVECYSCRFPYDTTFIHRHYGRYFFYLLNIVVAL